MDGDARAGAAPAARADEVHVWRVGLDPPPAVLDACRGVLSDDERARMGRYHFAVHRRRFCAGRGTLRRLLGRYLGLPPADLRFAYGEHGKPALAGSELCFNLSHSADEALIGVALGRELGIDIERVKPGIDALKLARRFFSPQEVERLLACGDEARPGAFFDCWTRKESFVKALGGGLRLPLAGFDVAFGPGVEARLLRVDWEPEAVARWSLAGLAVAEGFRGALAVEGRDHRLRYRDAATVDLV